ncbi:uncharacterized protein Dwil_GK16833 [Drosophila willistoni]|uniref:Uncharacterized protein n=1 Tax=Drosophila willistoni TaxID=7260 RepID=B4ML24_DROWI|nr:uncharacterized protein Dwil_GK16833 [Drosophila willistoni]
MPKRMMSTNPLPFRIQLLSGRSVVLVEEPSHESEIFLPQLLHGRIVLENVVHSRQRRLRESETNLAGRRLRQNCRSQRLMGGGGSGGQQKVTTATVGLAPLAIMDNGLMLQSQLQFQLQQKQQQLQHPCITLKLILNGKVVLVECNGYESEIFLPHICSHCIAMKRVTANQLVQVQNSHKRPSNKAPSSYASTAAECSPYNPSLNQANRMLIHPMQMLDRHAENSIAFGKEQLLKLSKKERNRRRRLNYNQNQNHMKQSGAAAAVALESPI